MCVDACRSFRWLVALGFGAAVLACGGGGGSPPPPANRPPTATAQSFSTPRGVPHALVLSGSDPEGSPLTFAVVAPPAHGALDGVAPALTYTPPPDYEGADAFTFTVSDGASVSLPATVSITVTHVNHAPVAAPDAVATDHGWPVALDPLANDGDADGDPLHLASVSAPAHGTAALVAGGLEYLPAPGFAGADAFTYVVSDPFEATAIGTVSVTVRPAAAVHLSSSSLSFGAGQDGPDPAAQPLDVSNGGGSTLRWTVRADVPWLVPSPAAGSGTGGAGTVDVRALVTRTESWRPTATAGAPSGRYGHGAAWTGRALVVWGGRAEAGGGGAFLGDGAAYDPAADEWTGPIATVGAPAPRNGHAMVWTGREVIVWGGQGEGPGFLGDGARYDPARDRWSPMSSVGAPSPRETPAAAWTGEELVVWGGSAGGAPLADGARYDPASDTWRPMSVAGAPAARTRAAAAFTGAEVVVWGGFDGTALLATGARYDPVADAWTGPMPTDGAPAARELATAIWTGEELVVWGGGALSSPYGRTDGGRWRPADGWVGVTSRELSGVTAQRLAHAAAWTGAEMVVWGGAFAGATGGRYTPPLALRPGLHAGRLTVLDPDAVPSAASVEVTLQVDPVSRLASAFTLASATAAGDYVYPVALAAAPSGGAFATGTLPGTGGASGLVFGAGQAGEVTLTEPAQTWIARAGPDGTLGWAKLATSALPGSLRWNCSARGTAMARLVGGDVVVAGNFVGDEVFGPDAAGSVTLSGEAVGGNAYLAAFDADGGFRWVRRVGGDGGSMISSLAPLPGGGALVAGRFDGTVVFGRGEANETTLSAPATGARGFVARIGADGALAWVNAAGGELGTSWESARSPLVAAAADGGALLAGEFTGTVGFGDGTPAEVSFTAGATERALFLARYGPDGALAWARRTDGPGGNVWARGIAPSPEGGALVTGTLTGGATFGPGDPAATTLFAAGAAAVVARWDGTGALAWARASSTTQIFPEGAGVVLGMPEGDALAVLPDGGAAFAGHFDTFSTFWPGELASAGDFDLFVGRLAADGAVRWVRRGGGAGADLADAAVLGDDGALVVVGRAGPSATFGPGEPGEVTLGAAVPGARQIVIVRSSP